MNNISKTLTYNLYLIMEGANDPSNFSFKKDIKKNILRLLPENVDVSFIYGTFLSQFNNIHIIEDNKYKFSFSITLLVEGPDSNINSQININDLGELELILVTEDNQDINIVGMEENEVPIYMSEEIDSLTEQFELIDTQSLLESLTKGWTISHILKVNDTDRATIASTILKEHYQEVKSLGEKQNYHFISFRHPLKEDNEEDEISWRITYQLKEALHEDDTSNKVDEIIQAPNLETAVKYAEQNARIKARENSSWNKAEIIAITKNENNIE